MYLEFHSYTLPLTNHKLMSLIFPHKPNVALKVHSDSLVINFVLIDSAVGHCILTTEASS